MIRAQPLAPDMLIVLDRSASMLPVFNATFTDRWTPSVSALKQVTSELQQVVRFGLMTFPHRSGGGGPCGTGKVDVQIAGGNAREIARMLDASLPDLGSTPTDAALREALKVLGSGLAGPDEYVAPKYVLLVTDGMPSCQGFGTTDSAMINATKAAIQALHDEGIKTFVVGYDVTDVAATMNEFAAVGGTGSYIAVSSGDALLAEVRKIAGQLAPCEYVLDEEPEDPTYVLVEINGVSKPLATSDGFVVEGKTVRLQGSSCNEVQDGREHAVKIEVQCEAVHIL